MSRAAFLALSLIVWLPAQGDLLDLFGSDKLTDGSRFAFVPSKADPAVIAIDAIDRDVAAVIELPHIAAEVVATTELDLLVATHPDHESATVVSLYDQEIVKQLDLGMRPDVVLRNTYDRFVTFGSADGTISTWDLSGFNEVLRVDGLTQATLLTFSFDGSQLFVVEPARTRISVIDMSKKAVVQEILLGEGGTPDTDISAVSRSADGFTGYVSLGSENRLAVIDLVRLQVMETIKVGRQPLRPYSTADNRYVLVPNRGDETLTIYAPREQRIVATIPVGIPVRDVNSGWLDTVAFVMPEEGGKVAVVDLQRLEAAPAIVLPGRTDDGIVTSDSKTLITAIVETGEVAIIDARARELSALVASGTASLGGVDIALSNNVCH
jgi:DNA-binding beta-propeller fold protein YncE